MAKLTITPNHLPSLAEFEHWLRQSQALHSPMDELLGLLQDLVKFEQQYGQTSDIFYAQFMRGELGDAVPLIEWAGLYELYLAAKQELATQIGRRTHVEELLVAAV